MEKIKINLDILLPEIPGERDACVSRIIELVQHKRGIEKVHIIPAEKDHDAQLCFHYNPEQISIRDVEHIARQEGASITSQYGHLLLEVKGIRQPRHARIIESGLKKIKGVMNASVSGTGFIRLEYNKEEISEKRIRQEVNKEGLTIKQTVKEENEHMHEEHEQIIKEPTNRLKEGRMEPEHAHEEPEHSHEEPEHAHEEPEHSHEEHEHGSKQGKHEHAHGGIFGEKTELIFAIISGILLGIGFGLSFIQDLSSYIPIALYIGAYFFGGFFTTKEAIEGISKGDFEIDFLMLVAAAGAALLGEWAEGALLLFLFSLGHSLEHYAMEKARKSIAALSDLAPKTALLKKENAITEIKIEELKIGDTILVKPNSTISADGFVVKGNSSVNQAPITGESIPVDKMPVEDLNLSPNDADKLEEKFRVFAGSINGGEALEIKVTRLADQSTVARLVQLVNEAQTQKSPTQNFTDKLEKFYVPSVLILVVLLLFVFLVKDEPFSASFYRAMAVLVAASPCALAISTPSAVLSGVARAARGGVLVKGGRPLEELGSLTAIAFDKTGTLTEGKPKLTGVYPLNGVTEEHLLQTVIAVEQLSDHPLAAAIVKGGKEKLKQEVNPATGLEAITGRGIKAMHEGHVIHVGNIALYEEKDPSFPQQTREKMESLEAEGNTTMLVQEDDKFIGIITLMDVERTEAKKALSQLQKVGIRKMIMLTGDNQKVADAIAGKIGLTDAWGNLLPEQKVEAIEKLQQSDNKVAMVGDGVNDAPALAKSTVGIAMGAAGSDVALETADIALMADKLNNLPFAIGLSRKAHSIIRQNLYISLGMVVIMIPLTISGIAQIGPAVIGHEGSTLVVVFNALRLLAYRAPI